MDSRAGFGIQDPDTPAFQRDWPAVGRTWGRVDAVGDRRLVQLFFSCEWAPDFTREFEVTDAGWLLWAGDASSRWF